MLKAFQGQEGWGKTVMTGTNKGSVLLFVIFMACWVCGCSAERGQQISETAEETDKYAHLTMFCDVEFWNPPAWDEAAGTITGDISRQTGVALDVIETTPEADTQLKIMLLNDKLPDIISVVDSTTISQLVSSGKVWKLDEFLQQYYPDSHLLQYYPEDIKTELIKRDKGWYALPSHINSEDAKKKWCPTLRYQSLDKYSSNYAIIWNRDLLQRAGLCVEDLQTEEEVLEAFEKVKGLNLRVDGQEVIPLLIDGKQYQDSTLSFLENTFGAEWLDDDGKYRDILLQPQTRTALDFLNTAIRLGYSQPEQINMDIKDVQELMENGRVLCFIGNINNTSVVISDWISSGVIRAADGCRPVYGLSSQAGTGWISTFISKDCKYPEKVALFIDYMTSEEGMVLWNLGYENIDYYIDEEGFYRWLITPEEIEDKNLQIWWMFVNTAWQRSVMKDENELSRSDDDAHTAYGRNQATVTYDAALYSMPEGFGSLADEIADLEGIIEEWSTKQIEKVILAESEDSFEQQYNILMQGLAERGIEKLNKWKQESYLLNCEEYGKENHKIN